MAVIVREKVKGSGEWWVFINHRGKRRSKKIGSKKAANSVKREVEARLSKGDMGMLKEKCPSAAEYGRKWLGSPLREWEDTTRNNQNGVVKNHIKPILGSKRLDEVRRKEVAPRSIRLHDLRRRYSTLRIAKGDNIWLFPGNLAITRWVLLSTSTVTGC